VSGFPHRKRDVVGTRGRGVGGFGEGPGHLFGREGGIVLIVRKAEVRVRWGFQGKRWWRRVSATSSRSEAPDRSGNLCGGGPNAKHLAVQREYGGLNTVTFIF